MVENIGTQLTMAHEDPKNLARRKNVLGPDLFFKSDGSIDPKLLHYLHPSQEMLTNDLLLSFMLSILCIGLLCNKN